MARYLKLANMWSERLLARYQKAIGQGHKIDVETVCSKGFLAEILHEHASLGRLFPGVLHRQHLIEDGVPLRAQRKAMKKAKAEHRTASGFVLFKADCEARAEQEAPRRNKVEHRNYLIDLSSQWKAMSDETQQPYKDRARAQHSRRIATQEEEGQEEDGLATRPSSNTFISACGNERTPFTVEAFEHDIRNLLDVGSSAALPGFCSYSEKYRLEWQRTCVVDNAANDIPADAVFDYPVPCGLAHPGLCAAQDNDIVDAVYTCAKGLQHYFAHKPRGSVHTLLFDREDMTVSVAHVVRAHYRGGGPRVVMLVLYEECGGDLLWTPHEDGTEQWVHYLDKSLCALHFRLAVVARTKVKQVVAVPRKADLDRATLSGETFYVLPPSMDNAVEVFPSFQATRARARDPLAEGLANALRAALGCRKKTARKSQSAVRLLLPKGVVRSKNVHGDAADACDSDWTWEAMSDAARSHGDDDSDAEDAEDVVDPRQAAGEPWGPFSVARIMSRNKDTGEKHHIGWGATCYLHVNDDDKPGTVCKKHLSGTSDETHRMVCHWLLLGHPCCGPKARSNHLDVPVRSLGVPSWDELVQQRIERFGS